MKRILTVFTLFITLVVSAQVPQVPNKIMFGDMQLSINSAAQSTIQKDVDRIHRSPTYFNKMVAKANLFFPIIEKVFAEENCPDEIKYLIIQESAINPDAVSSSNAVGYWQFKEATGKEVGLTIQGGIDERKNIERASRAAATYINKNNTRLDNYVYALTSYNTGLGGVQKYVRPKYLGAKKMNIDGRTHWYFLKFLAHYIAYKDYVGKQPHEKKLVVDENQGGKSVKQVAKEYRLDIDELDQYNRWISSNKRIPTDKKYAVILPLPNDGSSVNSQTSVVASSNADQEVREREIQANIDTDVHQGLNKFKSSYKFDMNRLPAVKAGDKDNVSSLLGYSKKELSDKNFRKYNDMRRFDQIESGQVYYLKKKKRKARLASYHVVKKGESLWEISQYYGIRLRSLQRKNHLKRKQTYVKEGMVLWLRIKRPAEVPVEYKKLKSKEPKQEESETTDIDSDKNKELPDAKIEEAVKEEVVEEVVEIVDEPESHETKAPVIEEAVEVEETTEEVKEEVAEEIIEELGNKIHTVAAGETLYSISRKYQISVDEIKKMNPEMGAVLSVGQEIVVGKSTNEEVFDEAKPTLETYIVKQGDTLYSIARKFTVDVNTIRTANEMTSSSHLKIGQVLKIPSKN